MIVLAILFGAAMMIATAIIIIAIVAGVITYQDLIPHLNQYWAIVPAITTILFIRFVNRKRR